MSRGKTLIPFNVLVLVTFQVLEHDDDDGAHWGSRSGQSRFSSTPNLILSENLFAKMIAWFHVIHLAFDE